MLPPESLWVQYSLIAILVLATGVIAVAFHRLWKELLQWIDVQDQKRESERERQRSWQAEQDKIRDQRWQDFLRIMQEEINAQDGRQTEALKHLSAKIDVLILAVNNHDVWARARDRE